MSESEGASDLTSAYESSVMERTSEVLEHPEASESPSSAEQLSAEDKHDSDEPIVLKEIPDVRKELPDLDVTPESDKEQVVDEKVEEVNVLKEVPDLAQVLIPVKEFSLDSAESEESDAPTTKNDDEPRDTIVQKELPDLNVDEKDERKKMLKEMPDLAQVLKLVEESILDSAESEESDAPTTKKDDEPRDTIVQKELPDLNVDKKDEQKMLKEMPELAQVLKLVEESVLDSAESGESDVPTAEPNDELRDSDEPIVQKELLDLDVTPESGGEQVIDEQNGLVEVPDLDEAPELVRNLDSPTRGKSYSQFENSACESVFSVKKRRNHGTFNWWTMFPVRWKTKTPYWLSILLLLLLWSEFSNATNFRGQTSGLNLRANRHVYNVGSSPHLSCIGSNSVQWWLNGSVIDLGDIDAEEDNQNENFAVLTINNISIRLNNAQLQCYNGVTESNKVTLQIRGPPSPPTSLTYDRIHHTVSWSAGYSLYSNATYCLEIYVLPSLDVLDSICNWNKTYFSVELWSNLLVCGKILVQITAENSAGNSTSETIMIASAEYNITDIVIQAELNTTDKAVYLSFTTAICIERTEVLADGVPMLPSMVEGQGNMISVTLPDNKMYDSLIVHDTGSGFTALAERIVTYDVFNIEVEPDPSMLNIGAAFLSNTSALGVLYVVIHCNELRVLDLEKSYYFPVKREIAEQVAFYLNVPPGEYLLLAYDIEWDGQIQRSGLPADTKYITVNQSTGGSEVNSSDKCSIDSVELIANVTCYCELGYYQVVFLEHGLRSITSKQQECAKSVSFEFGHGKTYSVAAFQEDNFDGVFDKPFFSKSSVVGSQIGNSDGTHIPTTEEEESSSSKIIGISMSLGLCAAIIAIIIIVFLIILVQHCKKKKCNVLNLSNYSIV